MEIKGTQVGKKIKKNDKNTNSSLQHAKHIEVFKRLSDTNPTKYIQVQSFGEYFS